MPAQSTSVSDANAGAGTAFTFNLERPEGNQYLSQVSTTLPEGLAGAVPAVEQCPEPQASQGSCPSGSQIGTATVLAGSGPTPYSFSGPVYFTGPYNNAPFGLSIAVPAVAGPFNLGTVVTRATINVQQYTGQVIVGTTLPRIVKGVPMRLRKITVTVNKQGFMSNPDQLRRAVHGKLGHRVRPRQQRKLDGRGQVPVPGRQLQRPGVQAVVHGNELRKGLESQRREP